METETHLLVAYSSSDFILQSAIAFPIVLFAEILLFIALVSVNGAEVAFFTLSSSIKTNLEKSKTRKAKIIRKLLSKPQKLMATLVVANVFFKIAIIVTSFFLTITLTQQAEILSWWFIIIIVIFGIVILIFFCEVIPKIYAGFKTERFLLAIVYWIYFLQKFFNPISNIFYKITALYNQRAINKSSQIAVDDLTDAIELASESSSEEEDIFKGIVKFGNTDVSEILKPRIDIIAVDFKMSLSQVLSVVVESEYSRIPVYEDTFDNIKGILYVKDLLPYINEKDSFRWQSLMRLPYFVPETKKVKELLTEFQTNKIHMAVIVDEYGGTLGIVTLEDVLEEIVGEISDESDEDEKSYIQINDNTYVFDGKTLLNDFYKILQTKATIFEEIKGEADTLAGLILEIKGTLPVKNEQIIYKQFVFKIEAVDSRRIKQIRVTINYISKNA